MFGDLAIMSAGPVFLVSERSGNIRPRTSEGFYAYDTRFLSSFILTIDGRELIPLGSYTFDSSLASFYASSSGTRRMPASTISVVRDRYIAHGLHEDITLINHSSKTRTINLELTFDADFADVFEVRLGSVRKAGRISVECPGPNHLSLVYERGRFRRETWITFNGEPQFQGNTAVFSITLEPKEPWRTCVTILPVLDRPPEQMRCVKSILGNPFGQYRRGITHLDRLPEPQEAGQPLEELPEMEPDNPVFRQVYEQAVADLRSLRLRQEDGHYILAAGLPWFVALFGRDSIISAIQTKLLGTELMVGTLYTLASHQATEVNEFRDAEPGKIPHEIRRGELSFMEDLPHAAYYGSVDATPLFLILLWCAYQWTGDIGLLRRFLPAAEAALAWIDRYGDMDGDGFVEYERRSRRGLRNQGWKDSWDGVIDLDGGIPVGPVALVEVQAYYYLALLRAAEVLRALGNSEAAADAENRAKNLRQKFIRAFWLEEEEFLAFALDGNKKPLKTPVSNAGQCLFTGILPGEMARAVARRLFGPEMYSGWGIRTMSKAVKPYNPMSYHNGSVWPHDNAIIACGLRTLGLFNFLEQIITNLFEAAVYFPYYRLPEVFCGFTRRQEGGPVFYPTACNPQAWAVGTIPFLVRIMLGITCRRQEVHICKPLLPSWVGELVVRNLQAGTGRADLEFTRKQGKTYCSVLKTTGDVRVIIET